MRVGLYHGEWGDSSKYREFECCEINIDQMTPTEEYKIYIDGATQTIEDIEVTVKHFGIKTAGCAKIVNPITDLSKCIMAEPFWTWNSDLNLREFMGGHFTAQNFSEKPNDWDNAVYWKYYTRTADSNFVQWKSPATTYNQGTTYYTCDSEEYEAQKIYYGKGDYAPSFVIGQCLYNPPWSTGRALGLPESDIPGASFNGYCCGSSLSGPGAGVARTRWFAIKGGREEYTGYDGMHPYTQSAGTYLHYLPNSIMDSDPPQTGNVKHRWQMAHIIYNQKEWIGWGEIKFNAEHPDEMQSADFSCVPIELFEGAIDPDPEDVPSYDNGIPSGNDGSAGVGSGLPEGDHMVATELSGVVDLAGTSANGLHAYVINSTYLMALNDYLWLKPTLADITDALKRWVFNPFNGVLGVHKLPHVLMPTNLGEEAAIHLAGTLCDGNDGDPLIKGYPILSHFESCAGGVGEPDYTFTLNLDKKRLPYNSFQDFANTSVTLHIPFCGDISIDPDKCIGGKVEVYMQCDCLTGNLGVQVQAYDMNGNDHIVGVMTGNCAYHIPISSSEYNVGGMMASLGQMGMSAITGNFMGMLGGATGMLQNRQQTMISGQLGGNQGWLGFLGVTLTVTYTQFVNTGKTYNDVNGRPCASDTKYVKDFKGYGEMKVNTSAITGANDVEKDKIRQILETGVIV